MRRGPSGARGVCMHYLHCILVRFDDGDLVSFTADELADVARADAFSATQSYLDRAFDWRAENAGRWADQFPRNGVVLGLVEREQFLSLLNEWKDRPLRNALEELKWARGKDWRWRTKEELDRDGAVVFENPLNGKGDKYWSAVPLPQEAFLLSEKMLHLIWSEGHWGYRVWKAVSLAAGEYLPDSQFYSVPDCSPQASQEVLREARERPEKFALVFLDYHY